MIATDEFDLRFNDRVLSFHAFINTDRDHEPIGREIQRVVKGPRLDASAMWIEGYSGDAGIAAWDKMCRERELANTFTLQHDGRVLAFHVFVNTDANPYHVHKRVLAIARGERLDACVCWAEAFEGANGRKAWEVIQAVVVKAHADPNARPYSIMEPRR